MADIDRTDAAGLIPEAYRNDFLQNIIAESAVLSTFNTVRVGTKVNHFPVVSALPTAGWVDEDPAPDPGGASGTKPTSAMAWTNKTITVEEVAVIVPVHENVLADSTIDLWSQIRPRIAEAFGAVIDDAVLFGTSKPASFRAGLVPAAIAAGAVSMIGNGDDIADAFNGAFGFVEADGNEVSIAYAGPAIRARLRGLRSTTGEFLYTDLRGGRMDPASPAGEVVFNTPLRVVRNGVWDDSEAVGLVADRSKLVAAIREDLTYKVLTEATVGGINLAEKDMVALRVKMRMGWEVATNATRLSSDPLPFAVVGAWPAS